MSEEKPKKGVDPLAQRILAVGFMALCIGFVLQGGFTATTPAPPRVDMAKAVSELVKPGYTYLPDVTSQKVEQTKIALAKHDYTAASTIANEVVKSSQLQNWRFYPMNVYVYALADTNSPDFSAALDGWVAADGKSPIPLIIRSLVYTELANEKRGGGFASSVSREHMKEFGDYLGKALADIDNVIQHHPDLPIAFYIKGSQLSRLGNTPAMEAAFQAGIARHPSYYGLYSQRLGTLVPKWGGSVDAMYDFTRAYAGNKPSDSPLRMLYLSLLDELFDTAYMGCSHLPRGAERNGCMDTALDTLIRPELEKGLYDAIELHRHADMHQYNVMVERDLSSMEERGGGTRHFAALLQLMANSLGTDTQLMQSRPGNNHYILDVITAKVWVQQGMYENAEKKYKEALIDIEKAPFPEETLRAKEISRIYGNMSAMYELQRVNDKWIAYQLASQEMVGDKSGTSEPICEAYTAMKDFSTAVEKCTAALTKGKDYKTLFYRARAYKGLGKTKEALDDYLAIADSEHNYRTSAVIAAGIIYSERGDDKATLALYQAYPYIFDLKNQRESDLAVSYNNRCYTLMKLGELQKALDDCNESLRHGNIPDAYQKRQQLMQQLAKHQTGT